MMRMIVKENHRDRIDLIEEVILHPDHRHTVIALVDLEVHRIQAHAHLLLDDHLNLILLQRPLHTIRNTIKLT